MSGLLNDRTTGAPLCAFIQNTDTRSKDYSNLHAARPGHADYTGAMRYRASMTCVAADISPAV